MRSWRRGFTIWFEIDPEYYRLASERLERERAQIGIMELLQG